jgi:hypothetical protein
VFLSFFLLFLSYLWFPSILSLSSLCEAQARKPEIHTISSSFEVFCRIVSLIAAYTRQIIEVAEELTNIVVENLAEENESTFSSISFNIYQNTRPPPCQIPSAESSKS